MHGKKDAPKDLRFPGRVKIDTMVMWLVLFFVLGFASGIIILDLVMTPGDVRYDRIHKAGYLQGQTDCVEGKLNVKKEVTETWVLIEEQ